MKLFMYDNAGPFESPLLPRTSLSSNVDAEGLGLGESMHKKAQCLEVGLGSPFMVRTNVSWVMVTWSPL